MTQTTWVSTVSNLYVEVHAPFEERGNVAFLRACRPSILTVIPAGLPNNGGRLKTSLEKIGRDYMVCNTVEPDTCNGSYKWKARYQVCETQSIPLLIHKVAWQFSDVLCLVANDLHDAARELCRWAEETEQRNELAEWPYIVVTLRECQQVQESRLDDRQRLRDYCYTKLGPDASRRIRDRVDHLLARSGIYQIAVDAETQPMEFVASFIEVARIAHKERAKRAHEWSLRTLISLVDGFCATAAAGQLHTFNPVVALRQQIWPGDLAKRKSLVGDWLRLGSRATSLVSDISPLLGKVFYDDLRQLPHGKSLSAAYGLKSHYR